MALLHLFTKAYYPLVFLGLCYFAGLGLLTVPAIQNKYHSSSMP